MSGTPEIQQPQPIPQVPEGIQEIPETPEVPEPLQGEVQAVPTQITAQVQDDQGKPMMTSPATAQVTVTIPKTQQQLIDLSKGNPTNSITWFAAFWIRLIKKAIHFGWQILQGGGE
jgi:outer membrane biosynthesis protein TonB